MGSSLSHCQLLNSSISNSQLTPRGLRIAGPEVFQQYQRIRLAAIFHADACGGGCGADEALVFRHLSEADHRGGRDLQAVQRAVSLRENQSVGCGVLDRDGALRLDGEFLRRVPLRSVGDPDLAVPVCRLVRDGLWLIAITLAEARVDVSVPIEHPDDVVEIAMLLWWDVLDQQVPRRHPPFNLRLKHCEDVAVDLWLVGEERARRVQDARI